MRRKGNGLFIKKVYFHKTGIYGILQNFNYILLTRVRRCIYL